MTSRLETGKPPTFFNSVCFFFEWAILAFPGSESTVSGEFESKTTAEAILSLFTHYLYLHLLSFRYLSVSHNLLTELPTLVHSLFSHYL